MQIPLSERPGRHERHFRRKLDNPFFPRPVNGYTDDELLEVQRLDHEEIIAFLGRLRTLINQAVNLKNNEESQVVLDLKAELETLYETGCHLGDLQGNNKSAIRELLKVIMTTVRAHAGGDSKAENELYQEEMARQQHFAMLEHKLVADLLDPETLILEDELAAVMMSEEEGEVKAALTLLDESQRSLLAQQAMQLLSRQGLDTDESWLRRVDLIRSTPQENTQPG